MRSRPTDPGSFEDSVARSAAGRPSGRRRSAVLLLAAVLAVPPWVPGQDEDPGSAVPVQEPPAEPASAARLSIAELAERVLPSLVTVSHESRDGGIAGSGSGFVVSPDGLIATCFHVIGEARRIRVAFADGRTFEVSGIHAFDRKLDLAILRIDAEGLPALPLGDSTALVQGERIAAMGNPRGLEFSVVEGLVSAVRSVELFASYGPMIQLAIPIEQGNSGGPALDLGGRVVGLLSVKSLVTENLGFASPINALKPLLEKPNPIPMDRWLTIGALDRHRWTTPMGGRWRQRAGRIIAEDPGAGFGGRALCLWHQSPGDEVYEVAVDVRLDDESGAAGLIFASDGGDIHYGFYPSGGSLRFTRFEGPSVYSWTILDQIRTDAYEPGEWNRLRVRVEPDRILGFVNEQLVLESTDTALRGGQVGLAKFRDTVAEFRGFAVGSDLARPDPPAELAEALRETVDSLTRQGGAGGGGRDSLGRLPEYSRRLLRERADTLEATARELRRLAERVHLEDVRDQLLACLEPTATEGADPAETPPGAVDLARAALLVARLDNEELDVDAYLGEVARLAAAVSERIAAAPDTDPLDHLNAFLFDDNGFHGSRHDYYNRSNSYLNEVLDDREGIPITLSVLYLEVARRAGIASLHGLPLPGHFIVARLREGERAAAGDDEPPEQAGPSTGPDREYIDVFERGSRLSQADADAIVAGFGAPSASAADYPPADARAIVIRMLRNLKGIAIDARETESALAYTELIVALDPEAADERLSRAILNLQLGDRERAAVDFRWMLEARPAGVDLERIREFLEQGRDRPDATGATPR